MKRTQAYYDKRMALAMLHDLTNPVNGLIGFNQIRKRAVVLFGEIVAFVILLLVYSILALPAFVWHWSKRKLRKG